MSEIKSALSVEEWAAGRVERGSTPADSVDIRFDAEGVSCGDGFHGAGDVEGTDRHALAAACLHGQPFGFTWADVDMLRREAERSASAYRTGDNAGYGEEPEALLALAARIAALLPPR